jgi:phage baseplate assembly protein W
MDGSITMSSAISLPFNFDATGSIATTADQGKIWEDRVIMTVMTNMGERVMQPTFGSDVPKAVGQNINDALSMIKQSVSVAFSRWLTSLELIDVSGYIDQADGYLVAQIKYRYRAQNIIQTINVKTAVLSRSGDILLEVAKNG